MSSNCTGALTADQFKECLKNHDLNRLWGYFGDEGSPNMWSEARQMRFYHNFTNLREEYDAKNEESYGTFDKTYSLIHSLWHCINECPMFAEWLGTGCLVMRRLLDTRDKPETDARIVKGLKLAYDSLDDGEERSLATGGYTPDKMLAFLVNAAGCIEIDGQMLFWGVLHGARDYIIEWWKDRERKEMGRECTFSDADIQNLDYRITAMLFASKTGKEYLKYLGDRLMKECDVWRTECIIQLTKDYIGDNLPKVETGVAKEE